MKLILTSVFALFLSMGFSQLKSVEYSVLPVDDHKGHNHSHESEETRKLMLKDFDYAEAEAKFVSLNLPAGEHDGWLNFRENEYIIEHFPDYFNTLVAPEGAKGAKGSNDEIPSKAASCPNAGFEDLGFGTEWTGGISTYTIPFNNNTIQTVGLNAAYNNQASRQTIVTIPAGNNDPTVGPVVGYDPIAINPATNLAEIPFIAPMGGNASVRLGNAASGRQKERLRYIYAVGPNNRAFYYQFAVIFQNPTGHDPNEQPYFKVRILDSVGAIVGGNCGQYDILSAQAATDTTYTMFTNASQQSFYRKWERVNVDLSAYMGQNITIEFETADCDLSGHFGYAYVDAGCLESIPAGVDYCLGDNQAHVYANPEPGAVSFQWFGPNNFIPIAGATNDTFVVNNPIVGDTFYVEVYDVDGCPLKQSVVIDYTYISLTDMIVSPTCYRANFGECLTDVTGGSSSGYNFVWTNTATGAVTASNSIGDYSSFYAGNYALNISGNNPNCGQVDTTFIVETFPVLVPDSITTNFCNGEGIITGPGNASNYQWYDNSGSAIPAPLGTDYFLVDLTAYQGEIVYLSYKLPNGCYDSTVYTLNDNTTNSYFNIGQPANSTCRSRQINYVDGSTASDLYNFVINGPNGFNFTSFNNPASQWVYNNLATGTYDVRVVDDGCFYDTTFIVSDVQDTVSSTIEFCPGTPVTLSSTSAGNHNWLDPNGNGLGGGNGVLTMTVPAPIEGTYYDSSQLTPGCYFVSAFHLDSTTLIASYAVNEPDCYGGFDGSITGSIVQGIAGPAFFSTTGPNGYSSNFNPATGLAAGTYTVTASVLTCTVTDEVVVGQPAFPEDTLWMYTQTCDELGKSTIYAPEGYSDYEWFLNGVAISGSTADSIDIDLPIDYNSIYVTYTSPWDGCEKKTTDYLFEPFSFNWNPDEFTNVFTPNTGDFVNNIYYPIYSSTKDQLEIGYLAGDYSLVIYNRWGNKVFESNNYLVGWDGTYKGSPVQDGSYFAEIMYRTLCDDKVNKVVQVVQVVR